MASTVHSELYNATLLIVNSENKVGRLQLGSIAGCKTKSVEVFSAMFGLISVTAYSAFSIFVPKSVYNRLYL